MALEIRPLHPVFVGEVSGIDLRQPLSPADAAAIDAGMDRYAVLVFHDQDINDEQQLAFSRTFRHARAEGAAGHHPQGVGEPAGAGHGRRLQPRQGQQGHVARRPPAVVQSRQPAVALRQLVTTRSRRSTRCCQARIIPSSGGNTEFADMRAAYDALDDETKAEIEDLVCEHSLHLLARHARLHRLHARRSVENFARCASAWCAPTRTGRKSLFLSFARRRDPRLAGAGSARFPARSDRARDAAPVRLLPTTGGSTIW